MKSIGTGFINDLSLHFNAGTSLIMDLKKSPGFDWSTVPRNLCTLVLEVFLFQATLGFFIPKEDLRAGYHNFMEIHRLLAQINPPSCDRVNRSPFDAGFYDLYAILYEVTLLHRSSHTAEISTTKVDALEKQILEIQPTVASTVFDHQIANEIQLVKVSETYNFYCAALLICINSLKAPSSERDDRIAAGVQIGLRIFHDNRLFTGNTYSLLWPIQVLRCAINLPTDITRFGMRFSVLRGCFYGISLRRSESLFQRVDQIVQRPVSSTERQLRLFEDDETIPRGMLLFRQTGGVLAQEF